MVSPRRWGPGWASAPDPRLAPSGDLSLAVRYLADVPSGVDAEVDAARMIIADLAAHHADIAVRTCRPGHLTGSALVVSSDREQALLLFHTKLQRWLQPGGHADGDTNLAGVALREATEETGIGDLRILMTPVDIDIHMVVPPAEDAHLHLDVRFLVVAPEGARPVGNHESQGLAWVPLDRLDRYGADRGLLRLAAGARLG